MVVGIQQMNLYEGLLNYESNNITPHNLIKLKIIILHHILTYIPTYLLPHWKYILGPTIWYIKWMQQGLIV